MLFGLFNRPKSQPSPLEIETIWDDDGAEMVSINGGDFVGWIARSQSGEWGAVWKEKLTAEERQSSDCDTEGYYALYNIARGVKVLEGYAMRPTHVKVANNGVVSLEDWCGQSLDGVFSVISPSGKTLVRKELDANIYGSWISNSGQYALCQTASNPKGKYGNCLIVFEVPSGQELFNVRTSGWGTTYEFDEDGPMFLTAHTNAGPIVYGKDGAVIAR